MKCDGHGLDEHGLIWMCATAILTGFSVSFAIAVGIRPTGALIAEAFYASCALRASQRH